MFDIIEITNAYDTTLIEEIIKYVIALPAIDNIIIGNKSKNCCNKPYEIIFFE